MLMETSAVPRRVLLADDHDVYRQTMTTLLRRRGYEVRAAACSDEVCAEASGFKPDLFLLDVKMPGNEDLQLVEQLREEYPEIPVILLTGFASLPSAVSAVRLNLFDYIQKTETPDHVLSRIEEAMHRADLERQLKDKEERYRRLARHLETIREEERRRISMDLHDEIGQIFTALKIDLSTLGKACSCEENVKGKFDRMLVLLDDGIRQIHSLCRQLRPGALDDLGLDEALNGLVSDWSARCGIRCDLSIELDEELLCDEVKTGTFRVVQEAITNISRHSEATECRIHIATDGENLVFVISDDGRGIPAAALSSSDSFGLLGMTERVESLGGVLQFECPPEQGTQICGTIPLNAEQGTVCE
ncbi:MAG: response regulator [Kiritimatiellales bacterium]